MFLDILSEFFSLCPLLSGKKITQNFLSPKIGSVSLTAVSENPIVRSYTDGGALYQSVFRLVLREPFDRSYNFSSFCLAFSAWVESVNSPSALPKLGGGFSPVSLSVIKSGEVSNSSSSFCEFEIVCRLLYSA